MIDILGGSYDTFESNKNAQLDHLGMDSLSRVELSNLIAENGVVIPPTVIGQMTIETLNIRIRGNDK